MSANGMHSCAASEVVVGGKPACARQVPHRLLMCPNHWKMVSVPVQKRLWLNYRTKDSDGRAQLTAGYLAAVKDCLDDVARKLGGTHESAHT
jgi:hypothetical protein